MLPLPKSALKETLLVDIPSASAIVSNISNPTYKEATKKRISIYRTTTVTKNDVQYQKEMGQKQRTLWRVPL